MIKVTRLNGTDLIVNAELIEFVENTPDTIITTTSGKKIIVRDDAESVIKKVLQYRQESFPWRKFKPVKDADIVRLAEESRTTEGNG